ncbi:uncharacterized protein RHOBADRAFT_55518 [Rhodotorula graminis WP1]|uniref:Uncharacterized protein n=1 Tax=Rhodotorula graminis (strain WP1) TaxID=578459 RepID=A0A0P9ITU6_RHOGW|nr:uncharacterized protein RHOBADRAFT_55518 [Rhodotorula graminis WP1]KPV72844.1 hypothetical protein RHOBADRAFT_55518 [Rhodotorula graminis WP1]
MAPSVSLSDDSLSNVLRPVLVGTFLSCCLCGVILCIACLYFKHFPRDRGVLRALVLFLTLSSIAVTATCSAWTWMISGKEITSTDDLMPLVPSFIFFLVVRGLTVCVTQLWYAWRCWVMGGRKRWWVPGLIAVGSVAAYGCIIFLTTQISPNKVLNDFMTVAIVTFGWLVLLLLVDLAITHVPLSLPPLEALLTGSPFSIRRIDTFWYLVWKPRKEHAGIVLNDSRLRQLAGLAAKTNAVGLLVQVIIIVLLFASPGKFIYAVPAMLESMLYSGSVIVSLLARDNPRGVSFSKYSLTTGAARSQGAQPTPINSMLQTSTSRTIALDQAQQRRKRSEATTAVGTLGPCYERDMDPACDVDDCDDDEQGVQSSEALSASTSDDVMGEKSCGAGEQEVDIAELDRVAQEDDEGAPRTAPTGDDVV